MFNFLKEIHCVEEFFTSDWFFEYSAKFEISFFILKKLKLNLENN